MHSNIKLCVTFLFMPYSFPKLSGFPDNSGGKDSACSARDSSSIPGSGRSTGEGIGYPLQYSWASPVTQLVNNLPAMQETWVWSPGLGRSPGERRGYPLQYSGLRSSMDCTVHGVAKSKTRLNDFHFHSKNCNENHKNTQMFFSAEIAIRINIREFDSIAPDESPDLSHMKIWILSLSKIHVFGCNNLQRVKNNRERERKKFAS